MTHTLEKYKTFGARFGAGIIDSLIFLPLVLLNNYLDGSFVNNPVFFVAWTVIAFSAYQVYSILMHGKYGQTIGKRVTGVKIVSYPEEAAINYKQAFMRDLPFNILVVIDIVIRILVYFFRELATDENVISLVEWLTYANMGWFLIEIITMLFNSKNRAVHDLIAKTVVIKV